MTKSSFAKRLLAWFDVHGRKHLPWQHPIHPYRVWVSEIMLQQTQVDTVIPYFLRFMDSFPTVETLAEAPIDSVLHHWTGLGYYARARNLHRCAQVVVTEFGGAFPSELDALESLPGIGPSTAAAIASIAFDLPTAICDGNVKRVLARHQAIAGWPGEKTVHDALWGIAKRNMPRKRCRDYTQAIMDLGATLCTRSKPRCFECPIRKDCVAYATDTVMTYPAKKPKKVKPVKRRYFLMFTNSKNEVWLEQRPETGIWGGLWSFPEVACDADLEQAIKQRVKKVGRVDKWPEWRHTFTHYHLDIHPIAVKLKGTKVAAIDTDNTLWHPLSQPITVGLAAPVKKLLGQLANPELQQETLAL